MDRVVNGIKHPFTGALHELDGEGGVKVTATDGTWGIFTTTGQWVRGELREADPHLCGWVGGPQYGNHRLHKAG
jgi:hypothetical protein